MRKIALLVAMAALSAHAYATDDGLKAKIEQMLKRPHPASAQMWRSLGSETPAALIAIHGETKSALTKLRTVEALGFYDDPKAVSFLEQTARTTQNPAIRRSAILAVARSQKMKEAAFYAEELKHADPHTRLVTAQALKRMKDPAATKMVDDFVKTENVSWVAGQLTRPEPTPSPRKQRDAAIR